MTEFHRKIELQSPEDLQYLIANIRRAANEKIDKDLPPIEGEDKMRQLVEELVHDYITTVFSSASENLTINGLPVSPSLISANTAPAQIEEHEPLDSTLYSRVVELARQEEQLVEEIAALRRKMPGVAVERAKDGYREGMKADEEELRGREELIRGEAEKKREWGLGVGVLARQVEMEANWCKGIKGLEGLKSGLPETVAKKERAERAESYVIAPEKKG